MNQFIDRPFEERQSSEVQEVISAPTPWLLRWGIFLICSLLTFIFLCAYYITFPDVLTVPITITSSDPPRSVVFREDGKLQDMFVSNGQSVSIGEILAVSETTGNPVQILELDQKIELVKQEYAKEQWNALLKMNWDGYNQLGELQLEFQKFVQELYEFRSFLKDGFYERKREILNQDINNTYTIESNLNEQLTLLSEDLELAKLDFGTQKKLFDSKVISALEYNREKSKLLTKEIPVKNHTSFIFNNRNARSLKQKELLELDNMAASSKVRFIQSVLAFQSNLLVWKQKHLLQAPVSGKVSYSSPWSLNQYVSADTEFATIDPAGKGVVGIITIPQSNFGKLSPGQRVLIKLNAYPFREYGIVEGAVTSYSPTTGKDSIYWGYVSLPNQLTTRTGNKLNYHNGMTGSAEIITRNRSLLSRLISAATP